MRTVREEIILRELSKEYAKTKSQKLLKAIHCLENENCEDGIRIVLDKNVNAEDASDIIKNYVRFTDSYHIGTSLKEVKSGYVVSITENGNEFTVSMSKNE